MNKEELPQKTTDAIERQRKHIFDAMAIVDVTAMSCKEFDTSREFALKLAYKLLDRVAGKLEEIHSYGTDGEETEDESDGNIPEVP